MTFNCYLINLYSFYAGKSEGCLRQFPTRCTLRVYDSMTQDAMQVLLGMRLVAERETRCILKTQTVSQADGC